MSTNSECLFIETSPKVWWYVLEDYCAPKNSWDWREHAQAYGPFKSEDEAAAHLFDNHANPGGSSTHPFEQGYKPDETMQKLMDDAKARRSRANRPMPYHGGRFR